MRTEKRSPNLLKRKRGDLALVPQHMRLSRKDTDEVIAKLKVEVRRMRWTCLSHPDRLFLSTRCVLSDQDAKKITQDFHLVTTVQILEQRLIGWRYWDTLGLTLWDVVNRISMEMRGVLKERHEVKLARDRHARQEKKEVQEASQAREYVEEHGLLHIKCIRLRISGDEPAHSQSAGILTASTECNQQLPVSAESSERLRSRLPKRRLTEVDLFALAPAAAKVRRTCLEVGIAHQ